MQTPDRCQMIQKCFSIVMVARSTAAVGNWGRVAICEYSGETAVVCEIFSKPVAQPHV